MSQVMSKLNQVADNIASRLSNLSHKPGESTSSRPGWMVRDSHPTHEGYRMANNAAGTFTGLKRNIFGRVLPVHIFSGAGLEILSTSYTGRPGKLVLKGNFLGAGRNIRVKISNHTL